MKNIEEMAEEYANSTLVGSPYVKKNAYIQGAKDILNEIILTLSVSEEGWLKSNIKSLIGSLKGNLTFEKKAIKDDINF